jgi:site-specific DNA-methyltransferase (adenine-specific)
VSTIADVLSGAARWCVVEGDSLALLQTLPDASVDHVITDPPYEAEAHTMGRRLRARRGGADEMLMMPLSFAPMTEASRSLAGAQMARLVKRWCVAFCQVEAAMLWRESLAALSYKRTGVWVKPDGMPQYSGDRPGMGYESIVFAHTPGRSRWNGGGRVGVFVHNKNTGGKHDHETQKPLPLMVELVSLMTDQGDVILDPFAGSGTTGVAAIRLGRRFIGIEREPRYAAIARERLVAEEAGSTLAARRAGQVAMFGGDR